MTATIHYPDTHFLAVGKRVESAWDLGAQGIVIRDLGDGSVLVRWDAGPETACYPSDVEPAPQAREPHVGQHLQGCVSCYRFVEAIPVDFPAADLARLFAEPRA